MAASNTSGPDEPAELSAREKKILEGIEDDMVTADPSLARKMTRAARPEPGSRGWPAARHGALLIAALIYPDHRRRGFAAHLVGCPRPAHHPPARPLDPALPHQPLPQRSLPQRLRACS